MSNNFRVYSGRKASALRAAKSREESLKIDDSNAAVDADDDAREMEELSDKATREGAMIRANEARDELNRLFLRQAELEESARQWNVRMNDYEQSSLRGEKDELEKLRRDHDDEIERLEEKMRVENEIDEQERKSAAIGRKRMAKEGAGEEEEPRGKRQKTMESITAKAGGSASDSEMNNTPTGWMANSNAGDGSSGKIGVGEEKVSGSVQKEEELKLRYLLGGSAQ